MISAEVSTAAKMPAAVHSASHVSATNMYSAMPTTTNMAAAACVPTATTMTATMSSAVLRVERIHKKNTHARGQEDAQPERDNSLTSARSYPGLYTGLRIHKTTYGHSGQGQHLPAIALQVASPPND